MGQHFLTLLFSSLAIPACSMAASNSAFAFGICQLHQSSSDANIPTCSHDLPAIHALHAASPCRDAAGPSSSGPRPEGKRPVAVPQGAPPPLEGCRQFPERKMETVGESKHHHMLTGLPSTLMHCFAFCFQTIDACWMLHGNCLCMAKSDV